ncbi:hypothetical protein DAT35_56155 [Vitiosangium sp. GDMCC 1.1324]|nr:hypothetical protein DAT35_56155 [Vitiosangium sp. GDMCC 1.1324]
MSKRFTGLELLRRLASLVPPPRANLTRFHGVFAPGAKVRPFLLPQEGAEPGPEEDQCRAPPGKPAWAGQALLPRQLTRPVELAIGGIPAEGMAADVLLTSRFELVDTGLGRILAAVGVVPRQEPPIR